MSFTWFLGAPSALVVYHPLLGEVARVSGETAGRDHQNRDRHRHNSHGEYGHDGRGSVSGELPRDSKSPEPARQRLPIARPAGRLQDREHGSHPNCGGRKVR